MRNLLSFVLLVAAGCGTYTGHIFLPDSVKTIQAKITSDNLANSELLTNLVTRELRKTYQTTESNADIIIGGSATISRWYVPPAIDSGFITATDSHGHPLGSIEYRPGFLFSDRPDQFAKKIVEKIQKN